MAQHDFLECLRGQLDYPPFLQSHKLVLSGPFLDQIVRDPHKQWEEETVSDFLFKLCDFLTTSCVEQLDIRDDFLRRIPSRALFLEHMGAALDGKLKEIQCYDKALSIGSKVFVSLLRHAPYIEMLEGEVTFGSTLELREFAQTCKQCRFLRTVSLDMYLNGDSSESIDDLVHSLASVSSLREVHLSSLRKNKPVWTGTRCWQSLIQTPNLCTLGIHHMLTDQHCYELLHSRRDTTLQLDLTGNDKVISEVGSFHLFECVRDRTNICMLVDSSQKYANEIQFFSGLNRAGRAMFREGSVEECVQVLRRVQDEPGMAFFLLLMRPDICTNPSRFCS